MSGRARAARGQAVVEAALGLLVFTTVLVFLIHFSEISVLSVKVTAATHAALLDAPGYRLHRWPLDSSPSAQAVVEAANSANLRYGDFDGLSRTPGQGTGITQVFTRAPGLTVSCTPNGPGYDPHLFTALAYSDGGGIACQAQAQLSAFQFPRAVVEDSQGTGGLFKEQHYSMGPLQVCGMGRAWGGNCGARLTSMLDDWGLTGGGESQICPIVPDVPLPCPTNVPYWTMAFSVYGLSLVTNALGPDVSASALAEGITGQSLPFPFFHGAENVFWMSAMGEEVGFLQPLPVDPGGYYGPTAWIFAWPTTPGAIPPGPFIGAVPYPISYAQRDGCFLGKDCP